MVVEHVQQGNSNRRILIPLEKNGGISLGKPCPVSPPHGRDGAGEMQRAWEAMENEEQNSV